MARQHDQWGLISCLFHNQMITTLKARGIYCTFWKMLSSGPYESQVVGKSMFMKDGKMKKKLTVIIIVFAMLAAFTGTAAAAPLSSGNVTLVSVVFVPGKGPVFTFHVSGEYSKADLKGLVHIPGGRDFALYCTQVDDTTVTCTTSKKAAGNEVTVSWAGVTFSASVPADPQLNCYPIYDWTPTADAWMAYGRNCQRAEATYGDLIGWDNPEWGPSPYFFLPGSPNCFAEDIISDGYYFPICPPSIPF
jgi:hypothetical protein